MLLLEEVSSFDIGIICKHFFLGQSQSVLSLMNDLGQNSKLVDFSCINFHGVSPFGARENRQSFIFFRIRFDFQICLLCKQFELLDGL